MAQDQGVKGFKVGDLVSCQCNRLPDRQQARIAKFRDGDQAYLNFVKQDRRLDDWYPVSELTAWNEKEEEGPEIHTRTRHHSRDRGEERDEFEKIHRKMTNIKNIETVTLGAHTMRTWYFSPYPTPYYTARHIFLCEYCWSYFMTAEQLDHHSKSMCETHPPGREVYRSGDLSVFELRGESQKVACQCLCLLGKLFLDRKSLFYDVKGFAFYVLCECDAVSAHIVGFFSRELDNDENVMACIAIFPPYQKRGYGKLLIAMSYEMARRRSKPGKPEHPLSDLGAVAFRSFWKEALVNALAQYGDYALTIEDLEVITGIAKDDIIDVLEEYPPVTNVTGEYELEYANKEILARMGKMRKDDKGGLFDCRMLVWMDDDQVDK
jgi:histone acetyltransferase MYST1